MMGSCHNISGKHTSASPILAIHGSASNGSMWRDLETLCSRSQRRVLTPDLAGYGKSDSKVLNLNSTLEDRAAPIVETILGIAEPVHIVAHSFGASIAVYLAQTIPEHIRSVTMFEPVIPALLRDTGKVEDLELLADLLALSDVIRGSGARVGMESFVDFWSQSDKWKGLSEPVRKNLESLAAIVYQDFVEAYFNVDPGHFDNIDYAGPCALMYGANTTTQAVRMCEIISQKLPRATLDTLAGMGHMATYTHSTELFTRIHKHINALEKGIAPSAPAGQCA